MFSPEEVEIVKISIRVSIWATLCSLPFGLLAAFVLSRINFPGKIILDGLIHLPLVLPPVVVGYLLLVAFAPDGFLGHLLEIFGIRDLIELYILVDSIYLNIEYYIFKYIL